MARPDGRSNDELRPVRLTKDFVKFPLGSVLAEFGDTKVLCAATANDVQPRWMREQRRSGGWITGEYCMMPFSSPERMVREAARGRIGGRTHEIQRMVGRSLRAVADLEKLGERTIWIDCEVLQADGGTRTAAITGGFAALALAVKKMIADGLIEADPINEPVAAVSVGKVGGEIVLDLNYEEDCRAEVDMNVVMTGNGRLVEVQGTAEKRPFDRDELHRMLDAAEEGIRCLIGLQEELLGRKET